MKCAYCGKEAKGTKEHIISCSILDLFPECYVTFDGPRNNAYEADPTVKDVCAECNNKRISYIDSYAQKFISRYFVKKYKKDDIVKIEYDCTMIQKMLLKYAFNDMRAHKEDCSYFDEEMVSYLLDEKDVSPKPYITVLCGLAVNVSPAPDAMFGNLKLRWGQNPIFYSNSCISYYDYETGDVRLNDNVEKKNFADLKISYLFRFNSVQFLLLCWDKISEKIEYNNNLMEWCYPYCLLAPNKTEAELPVCTNEFNYHHEGHIHVKWDGIFTVGFMRCWENGGNYPEKEAYEKIWKKVEDLIRKEYPR